MKQYLIAYITVAVLFLGIDAVWLKFIANEFFHSQLEHLLADQPKLGVAVCFYMGYAAGIVYFAVKPALEQQRIKPAIYNGALFGFFCYAAYEFTNYATLRDWPLLILPVDILWGASLTALTAAAGFLAVKKLRS